MMQHENNRLPKLVRDRIPEIISASGKLPVTRTLELVRAKKAEQRGTFRARIMLESIMEQGQTEV